MTGFCERGYERSGATKGYFVSSGETFSFWRWLPHSISWICRGGEV